VGFTGMLAVRIGHGRCDAYEAQTYAIIFAGQQVLWRAELSRGVILGLHFHPMM
jgi:hypothetical protein